MYRITYTQGNGYHCGCCRRTSTNTDDCETEQEVIAWLSELEACQKESQYEDDSDRSVDEIREIKDEDLTDKFNADPAIVERIIEARKEYKRKKQEESDARKLEEKRKQLDNLKKELGEI